MSHPTEDELVDVAVGSAARDESVSAHVDTCEDCAATVAELRSTAGLVAAGLPDAAWQAPPASLWDRISEQIAADDLTGEESPGATAPTTGDLSGSPATSPTEDELGTRRARDADRSPRGRGRAIGWGAGLAAASLAIGLLAGRAIWQPEPPPQPVAQVALSTLDTKQEEGEASVVRTGQDLDLTVATTTPLDAGDGYLEVWLINSDGKRMVSVGVLAPGDEGSFPISQSLIDEGYVIVDISREQFDDSPTHSGDSLLRGTFPV